MEEEMVEIIRRNDFFSLESPKWSKFIIEHEPWNSEAEFQQMGKVIFNTIGKKNGIYVYRLNDQVLYIGKGNPIYGRVKSHYEECYRQPRGDKTGRWFRFFSQHRGTMEVLWRAVDNEGIQLFIEHAMTKHFKPKFLAY